MKATSHIPAFFCLACLVALCGPSLAAARAQEPEGMPIYTGARSRHFSGRLHTNMVPLDVAVFETADDAEKVVAFYRKALESRGKQVVEHAFGPSLVYIGYYDLATETMHLATVMSHSTGNTWIILSAMDPRQLQKPTEAPEWLPRLDGASDLVITQDSEGGAHNCSASFTVSGKSLDAVRSELMKKAGDLGWRREEGENSGEGEIMSFRRGGGRCIVQLRMVDQDKQQVLVSFVMFGGDSRTMGQGGADAEKKQ